MAEHLGLAIPDLSKNDGESVWLQHSQLKMSIPHIHYHPSRPYLQVGFDSGDGTNYYAAPGSQTVAIKNMRQRSNFGTPGRWLFKLDGATVETPGLLFADSQILSPLCMYSKSQVKSICVDNLHYWYTSGNCVRYIPVTMSS